MARRAQLLHAEEQLCDKALSYPEVTEEHPWGERAMKVRGKTFAFIHLGDEALSISMKLPHTGVDALGLPFAKPTGYGLGKSGWVTSRFGESDEVPVDLLLEWMDESYRAIAPKRIVRDL